MKRKISVAALLVVVLFAAVAFVMKSPEPSVSSTSASSISGDREWKAYGGDLKGDKYSDLDAINTGNISSLKPAWTFHTKHLEYRQEPGRENLLKPQSSFEATPIMVDKTLFFCDPYDRVFALDARTGEKKWMFDPELKGKISMFACRGVSTWKDPIANSGALCARRIFVGTLDARIIALDSQTGARCADFGNNGSIDLTVGMGEIWPGEYGLTSPPTVVNDLVISGAGVGDNLRIDSPAGVVRAYNARTGALVWGWNPVPKGVEPMTQGEWTRATPNAWTTFTADEANDRLFIPTGGPPPDLFGGLRNNFDEYGSSVVALQASTGKMLWSYQLVHHDLWDYDIPSQPSLFLMHKGGADVPAIAQATKVGHLFFLSQEGQPSSQEGVPLFPVEERPVPQSDVPGEHTSPTQRFPVIPPPLYPKNIFHTLTNLNGIRCWGADLGMRDDGVFTPPSFGGSVNYPGPLGGSDWGGVSIDPERRILVLTQNHLPMNTKLIRKYVPNTNKEETADYKAFKANFVIDTDYDMKGADYAAHRVPIVDATGTPCTGNPAGEMLAINIDTGAILWRQPFGTVPVLFLKIKGSPNQGGSLVTKGGLVFIGASTDAQFRAIDITNGHEVWNYKLNTPAIATPMTYAVDGDQYVVVASGGHALLKTKEGDEIRAFKLPSHAN